METEFIEKYLEKHSEMKAAEDTATEKILNEIVSTLEEADIDRLGLWEKSLVENGVPDYGTEDMEIFKNIEAPACNLKYYTATYNDEGRVFGIVIVNGKLYFVADNMCNDCKIIKALDAYHNPCKWHLDFYAVIEAIRNTIKINTSNRIPMEKWNISHFYGINPYSWDLDEDITDNIDDVDDPDLSDDDIDW
ncbi:MAG: hypothetical protein NC453_11465 [Muribaculum sp.]|nr:hypothetical protein [Muribaculum sp.]